MKHQYWLIPILFLWLFGACGISDDDCDYSFDGAIYSGTGFFSSEGITYGIRVELDVYGPGASHPFCTYRPYPITLTLPDSSTIDIYYGTLGATDRAKLVASDLAFANAPDEIYVDDITFDREKGSFGLRLAKVTNSVITNDWTLTMATTLIRE